MRQLGARLPEPPPVQTHRETHWVDPEEQVEPQPDLRDFHRLEPGHGRTIALEPVPRQEGTPWGLLEPERHHFPFLTVAVPALAAVLALGALLWNGSLRDRVHHQDDAVNALQRQNQKLQDTLDEMSVEQRASNALGSGMPAAAPPPARTVLPPAKQQPPEKPAAPQQQPQAPTADMAKPAEEQHAAAKAAQQSIQQPVQEKEPSKQERTGEMAHSPEIVPPYPTNYKSQNVANNPATSQPVPTPGAYHAPFSVASPDHPATGAGQAVTTPPVASTPAPPASSSLNRGAQPTPSQYDALGNGLYASPLAQNIETVENLQRHSTVPLQEFHVHEGMLTKVTPALGLSVQHPNAGHGTYSLIVNAGSGSYQLRGQVNNPLSFTDNVTHREYELVVLRIADQQVYGYVRAMR